MFNREVLVKAIDYVKTQLPGTYVWSPCRKTFVVKLNGEEIAPRASTKQSAWVKAKKQLESGPPIQFKINFGKEHAQ